MSMDAYDLNDTPHHDDTDAIVYCPVCHGEGTVSDSNLPCLRCDGTGELTLAEYDSAVPAVRVRPCSAPSDSPQADVRDGPSSCRTPSPSGE
jgi:DnaJ-class molecular chaperone